ncbi:MAG: hypothetical protein GX051_04955 [Clostridiales bacterium]|nr:hypothetical protein [Clostridiales bacterium]
MRRLFYSLLYAVGRAQERASRIYTTFTDEREKRHTEPFKRLCARPMIARKCATFFLCVLSPLSYLHFVLFRKKIFEKIFPQKHAKYAEQNAEQIELDMLKTLVYQGKTDISPYRVGISFKWF